MSCTGNCLQCGKCAGLPILDSYGRISRHTPREGFGIAVDIGTTSVVMELYDLYIGKSLARHSFLNPQRAFGPDVISRICAASSGSLEQLQCAVTGALLSGVQALLDACGTAKQTVADIVIAGNTVMTYLLLGLPCDSLGAYPFKPAFGLDASYGSKQLFGADFDCPVHIVPWLAAFVGGDITSGLLHALSYGSKRFLLMDLGTNGEMALYINGGLTVTSTAAGPAFESSSHGGGASAVMSSLAGLVRQGYLDETGLLSGDAQSELTQKEIRELQLAKSAIRAGLEIILETAAVEYDSLDTVYLAGGIGQAMNADDAVTIGLLPARLKDKIRAAGNAALGGAVRLLLAPELFGELDTLRNGCNEINLSAHPRFNDLFMEYMCF